VLDAGGQPNQFLGDGLLALFGLDADPATAWRRAVRAAAKIDANVAEVNRQPMLIRMVADPSLLPSLLNSTAPQRP
jgi:hypothetical protein